MKITRRRFAGTALLGVGAALSAPSLLGAQSRAKVTFYYPIQVGGPLTQVIDGYIAKFKAENPAIDVEAVYAGNYIDTTTKALTAAKAGTPPTTAILLATDIYTLLDAEVIQPLDDFVKSDADRAWVNGFMPAFLKSAQVKGKLWAAPFQRSTAVLYWNKKAFAESGLNPDKYPTTWDEMVAYGKAVLRKDPSGRTTRWGVGIPGNVGSAQWLFGALVAQNGGTLFKEDGTATFLSDKKVVDALQFWVDLSKVHGVHPPGIQEWGTTPQDFLEGRIAMIWTTTGNLTNIKKNATFDFGVAPYPGKVAPASVLGGGNFYVFTKAPQADKEAAFKFIKFMTSDELLADWCIQTGYVAPRDGAWETAALKKYVADMPAATVARRQIASSVPEFSTYDNARTTAVLNTAIGAALTGQKTAEKALADAQAEIDRILRPFRR